MMVRDNPGNPGRISALSGYISASGIICLRVSLQDHYDLLCNHPPSAWMSREPRRQNSVDPDGLGLTVDGALVILSLLKESSDAFPPLKAAASVTLGLLDSVQVS